MSHPNRLDRIGVALRALQNANFRALTEGEGRGLSTLQMVQLLERELVKVGVIEPIEVQNPGLQFEIDSSRCESLRVHGEPCGCILAIKGNECQHGIPWNRICKECERYER